MKVLLSIRPEYAERILDGSKRYEFRRSVFQNQQVKTVVIYATKPVGKVIGEFDVDHIVNETPARLWSITHAFAGISRDLFDRYFEGRQKGYAIKVKEVRRYEEPRDLESVTSSSVAPQSFCYVP